VVHLSRHGKPVAVLLPKQAYPALQGHQKRPTLWKAIVQWRGEALAGAQLVLHPIASAAPPERQLLDLYRAEPTPHLVCF
jgi:hypothetical protein